MTPTTAPIEKTDKHTLPPLPYDYAALEPYIDAQTMQIHHGKHHQAYVNNLNAALDKHPALYEKSLEALLRGITSVPEDIRTAVRNNGGGQHNHSLFWTIMAPAGKGGGGEPGGAGRRDQASVRRLRTVQGAAVRGRDDPVRQRLGVACRRGRQARGAQHRQPGQPPHGREDSGARTGRVGARVLPQVSEPPAGLRRRVVERRQLAGGRKAV